MQELLIAIFSSGSLTGVFTWFFTRKTTQKTERIAAKSSELDNVEKAVEIWRNLAENLEKRVADLQEEIHALRMELAQK